MTAGAEPAEPENPGPGEWSAAGREGRGRSGVKAWPPSAVSGLWTGLLLLGSGLESSRTSLLARLRGSPGGEVGGPWPSGRERLPAAPYITASGAAGPWEAAWGEQGREPA